MVPLNVVYQDAINRVIERVRRSPAGGQYVATCRSLELRQQVERAVADALGGPDKVVALNHTPGQVDPWNQVRQYQLDHGLRTQGVLYTLAGLTDPGPGTPEDQHPLAQLNLARDAWASTGTHLLLWLDGAAELARFSELAPDLWSFRSDVLVFVTLEEFATGEPDPAVVLEREEALARARTEFEDPTGTPGSKVAAGLGFASRLNQAGQAALAYETVLKCEEIINRLKVGDSRFLLMGVANEVAADVLIGMVRLDTAQVRAQWSLKHPSARPGVAARAIAKARYRGREAGLGVAGVEAVLAILGVAETWGAHVLLVQALTSAGQTARANASLPRMSQTAPADVLGVVLAVQSGVAANAADSHLVLADALQAAALNSRLGHDKSAANAVCQAAACLSELGLDDEARHVLGRVQALPLPDCDIETVRWEIASGADAAERSAAFTALLDRIRESAAPWLTRAYATEALDRIADSLVTDLRPDADLSALDHVARTVQSHADAERDAEVARRCDWIRAEIALLVGDRKRACRLAASALPWARRWRGPETEVLAWILLARVTDPASPALAHAHRAVTQADATINLFRRIGARQCRAEVYVRLGRTTDADADLIDALAIARGEGLRREELRLLHLRAELPGGESRDVAAADAVHLARRLQFPREEARALLNRVELGIGTTPVPTLLSWLARARMWIDALGPARLQSRLSGLEDRVRSLGPAHRTVTAAP